MKGNKRKVSAGRRQLTKYELQRIERLKSNLEKMKAQGAEFFASKILQEKTRGLDLCNELLEEKDDESASECDGGSNEDETIRDMETENLNCGLRQSLRGPSARPKTMGDFVKKNISKEQQHQQVEQVHDNNSTSSAMKVQEQCNLKKQQPPNLPHCEKTQQQKKQIIKSFCSPGSMSAYLQFRKKQVQNNAMARTSKIILNNVPTSRISDEHDDDIAFNEDANEDANEDDNVVGNGCEYDTNLEVEDLCEYRKEASKSKKHRGPTKLTEVHARTKEERQVIILNSLGQPVGPTKEVVNEFKFFLGTLGKDPELAPLNYTDFRILPTHDKIWDYVLEKYMVPEYGKTYVLEAVNASWRCYKCRFKKNHFYAYATNEERWAGKPDTISVPQFQELLDYWQCEQIEEESRINRENRLLLDDVHTMGRKSFAILRHELQQEDPNKHEPSQAKVYKESRKRVPGRTYLTNNEKVEENIAKMDALESTLHEEGSNSKDPYSEVIQDPKRKSRLRLVGKGVTKANLKKRDKNSRFIFPEEFLLSMKTELVQQLAPSVASVILSQLREANPGIDLVIPDFMIPSIPKDASSAPHVSEHNGQSSKSGGTVNQVQGDQNGEET